MSEEYGREVVRVCELLMRVLSVSLGLDEAHFQRAFGGADCGATLRANYYPRCPQPDLTLGLSAHSDPGALTVLLADENVRGLQVRRGDDGEWVTVQPVRDAFIVNVGDQVQITPSVGLLVARRGCDEFPGRDGSRIDCAIDTEGTMADHGEGTTSSQSWRLGQILGS